jgi:hypothetical protein
VLVDWRCPNSPELREGIIDILLNHTKLYKDLRDQGRQE